MYLAEKKKLEGLQAKLEAAEAAAGSQGSTSATDVEKKLTSSLKKLSKEKLQALCRDLTADPAPATKGPIVTAIIAHLLK